MASTMEHAVSYPFGVQRLWEVLSTEQYWRDLLEAINSSHGKLESFEFVDDTITVAMQQGVPEEKLPSIVTKVRPGDLEIPRRSTFTLAGDQITGEITATVAGAPAKVDGTLVVSGDPASATYRADVEVGVPFVGGKIEKAIIDQLVELLDSEREQTVTWEATNR
ncbi:DUF2505 family protein [Gordonia sp. SID5947]|uniref:DUF2505 domain-containing protein n=1 Tax=Gordonia sp. SID5947 TaxID=2690315 RepID=UPI0013705786|nr:DUF2505 domain-containing protein [Gordonia sp. SID5947]MYR07025.1 DUF2505 family protein [Gordonia sp. SID5947]